MITYSIIADGIIPAPKIKNPINIIVMLWEKQINVAASVAVIHEIVWVVFLPILSDKKLNSKYPKQAPTKNKDSPISLYYLFIYIQIINIYMVEIFLLFQSF